MEDTIEIETAERLLIFQNETEINRITQEAEGRARLLNKILSFGLVTNEALQRPMDIDSFIFNEQLKVNKPMSTQYKAGKKNLLGEYSLPEDLQSLKDALIAWYTYPVAIRGGNKYSYLKFSDHWNLDKEKLEREFVMRQLKIYIAGDQLAELKTLLVISDYFDETQAESGQVYTSPFWSKRFTGDDTLACNQLPKRKYMVKASYFRRQE